MSTGTFTPASDPMTGYRSAPDGKFRNGPTEAQRKAYETFLGAVNALSVAADVCEKEGVEPPYSFDWSHIKDDCDHWRIDPEETRRLEAEFYKKFGKVL